MLSQVALLGLAFFLAASTAGSWSMLVLTSATVALFLQQSGWLCHDILVQIFKILHLYFVTNFQKYSICDFTL